MRKTIVAFAGVAVLAAWGPAMADLCTDKKNGLATLEAEAPQIRADLAKKEQELESVRREMDKWDALAIGVAGGAVPAWLQLTAKAVGLNPKAYVNIEHDKHADKAAPLRDEIRSLKQRQTEVGSQIFLLRDIIAGLGCGTPTPPVDYRAIEQNTQQSQQAGPGGTPQAGSGAFGGSVQSQGPYGTPSSGFGPSGSTQPAGQQGQQPGYGPGPDESGSPQVPYGPILEGIQGSMGGGGSGPEKTHKNPMTGKPHPGGN